MARLRGLIDGLLLLAASVSAANCLTGCVSGAWDTGTGLVPISTPSHDPSGIWPEMVERAIDTWQESMGDCPFPFSVVELGTPDSLPVRLVPFDEWPHTEESVGWRSADGIDIRGSVGYKHELLLHELGHAMGMRHSDDPSSVMYYSTGPGQVITSIDVIVARRVVCGQ